MDLDFKPVVAASVPLGTAEGQRYVITAIGAKDYPTPTGTYYITDPVDLRADPSGPYGAYALGLSGHSDVLTEFAGSDGQIAIHGTPNPSDIGKDVSHGCVRVTNDTILKLSTLPLGTPVVIT